MDLDRSSCAHRAVASPNSCSKAAICACASPSSSVRRSIVVSRPADPGEEEDDDDEDDDESDSSSD